MSVEVESPEPRIAIIRTSDRTTFKRCRRKWGISSHFHRNRTESESAEYLWLGTGGHFALEDWYGYNNYGHPVEAFRAYCHAQKVYANQHAQYRLPESYDEQVELGEALLNYYVDYWLEGRDPLETLWVDGVPQVEVQCTARLPYSNEHYDEVYYQATFDRVVVVDNELWVLDYKFYNRDWTPNMDFDAQMSAYIWLAQSLYQDLGMPVRGAIVQKHFKKVPKQPRILKDGSLSGDKSQATTHRLYREAMINMYGEVANAPIKCQETLSALALKETENRDDYIARDKTERTQAQIESTGEQILMELPEMLNPHIALYKNDTKDCSYDCSFRDICLMMDDKVDWENYLETMTINRTEDRKSWRMHLPLPQPV